MQSTYLKKKFTSPTPAIISGFALVSNEYLKYFGTVSLHNLLKFIQLRSHEGAQWEIQQVAEACLEIAEEFFPNSVHAFIQNKMEK